MLELFDFALHVWTMLASPVRAGIVLAVGWILSNVARFLVTRILYLLRVEKLGTKLGLKEFLRKGGAQHSLVQLLGILTFWVVMAYSLFLTLKELNAALVSPLAMQIEMIIPKAFASALIVILGSVGMSFFSNFILTIARNAAFPHALLLSRAIKLSGITIVIAIALDQIGLGSTILGPMLLMLFGAIVFGTALAFGLGCKDIAKGAMENFLKNLRERARDDKSGDMEG